MLDKVFEFIAYNLEGKGQPSDDPNPTLYGITKTYYPKQYEYLGTKPTKQKIKKVYRQLYSMSPAQYLPTPLDIFLFDYWFNSTKHAIMDYQKTLNLLIGVNLVVDGLWGAKTYDANDFMVKSNDSTAYYRMAIYYNSLRIQHYLRVKNKDWRCGLVNRVARLENFVMSILI